MNRFTAVGLIFTFLSLAIIILWHFSTTNYYTASDVFWYGAIAGFLACLFLIFLVLMGILAFKIRKMRE